MNDMQYHNAGVLVKMWEQNTLLNYPGAHGMVKDMAAQLGINVTSLRKNCTSAMKRRMTAIRSVYYAERKKREGN